MPLLSTSIITVLWMTFDCVGYPREKNNFSTLRVFLCQPETHNTRQQSTSFNRSIGENRCCCKLSLYNIQQLAEADS
jgi:hypothetical protein